jgi:AraC-like DNA-binding protein
MKTIPDIPFEKNDQVSMDFEIFTLESLFARKGRVRRLLESPHRLEFYNIIFMEKTPGVHYVDFRLWPFEEGALLFVSKGQVHAFQVHPDRRGFAILFTESFMSKNLIRSNLLSLHRLYNYHLHPPVIQPSEMGGVDFGSLVREMHREYTAPDDFAKEEILRLLLKLLLVKAERAKNTLIDARRSGATQLEKFAAFKRLVESRFAETRNARDFASMMHMSYKRLNEISKNVSGKTAKSFVDSFVILESKRLLATTDLSVKELSYHMGFDEPTNFVKFFKKHARRTPSQFRRDVLK